MSHSPWPPTRPAGGASARTARTLTWPVPVDVTTGGGATAGNATLCCVPIGVGGVIAGRAESSGSGGEDVAAVGTGTDVVG